MRDIATRPSEAVERSLYPSIGLYIDGKWIYDREAVGQVRNPSTETVLGTAPKATLEDLDRALHAAEAGWRLWRDTPPSERVRIILRAVALLRERANSIAKILTLFGERQDARRREGGDRPVRQLLRVECWPVAA